MASNLGSTVPTGFVTSDTSSAVQLIVTVLQGVNGKNGPHEHRVRAHITTTEEHADETFIRTEVSDDESVVKTLQWLFGVVRGGRGRYEHPTASQMKTHVEV